MNANDKLAEAIGAVIDSKLSNAMRGGKSSTKATVTGVDSEGKTWVRVAGADRDTPVRRSAVEASVGDMVSVTIGNGMAVIDANLTDPAASGKRVDDVSDKAKKANDLAAKTAVKANMMSDVLYAHEGRFGHLEADTAYIRDLKADNITTQSITATVGYIEDLTSRNITTENITADHAKVGTLDADYARIDTANIDTATIREAWVDALMVQSGLIAHEGVVYELDAIQVNASKIKTGTLDVERLIVTQNGQKYLIHVDTSGGTPVTTYEKLDGNVIEDLTITADKIVAGAITAQKITTENIVGSGGWINLRNGTFNYVNATTGEGIAWDGSHLTLQAASLNAIFSSVKVGGKNLVTGTAHMSVGTGKRSDGTFRYSGPSGGSLSNVTSTGLPNTGMSGSIRCTNTGTNTGSFGFAQDMCYGLRVGETFTQSAWVRASTTVRGYFQPAWSSMGFTPGNGDASNMFTFTTEWQKFTWVGTLNGTQDEAYSIGYCYAIDLPQNAWFEVCGLQVERGNVATDWSPAMEDMRGIGGRNLVLGTGTAYSTAATSVSAGGWTAFDLYALVSAHSSMGLTLGEKLTVSCDVTLTGAVANTTLKIGTDAAPWEYFGVVATFAAGTSTQHIKATAVVTDSIRTSTGSKFRFRIDCPTAASALTVKAMNVKLERGDTATDWSPAPEDLATKTELQVTADGISSTVSKISSAKRVSATAESWPLADIKVYAAEGHSEGWNVDSTANLRVGDTVYVKGTDSTRKCTIYIKTTVTEVSSSTRFVGVSHGYEDVLPVDTIKSTINQSADSVKIKANHIDIQGTITAINNDTTTTIDGGKIETGSITIGQVSNLQSTLNGKASTSDASDAAKTATDYITKIDSNGIKMHPSSGESNRVSIDASGAWIYKNNYLKAFYGDTVTLYGGSSGSGGNPKMTLDATKMLFYDSQGTQRLGIDRSTTGVDIYDSSAVSVANFTGSSMRIGKAASGHSTVTADGMSIYGSNGSTLLAKFDGDGVTLSGHNSAVGTVVQASKAVSRTGSTVDATMLGAEITLGKGKWFVYVYWAFTAAASTSGASTITVSIHRASSANNSLEHTRFFVPTKNYARIGATCVADVTADTEKFYVHGGAGWAQNSGTTDSTRIGAIRIA